MVFMVDQKGVSSKVEKSKDWFAVAMIVLAFLLVGMSESLVEHAARQTESIHLGG